VFIFTNKFSVTESYYEAICRLNLQLYK